MNHPAPSSFRLGLAVRCIRTGGIVAYPTEAVFGLGCDPFNAKAVRRLLALKQRPQAKGLILIAAEFRQIEPLLEPLAAATWERVLASWPGPHTWLLPARPWVPVWIRGHHPSLAVRVTAHPVAAALCRALGGPLVSTSANLSRRPPARSVLALGLQFGDRIDALLPGRLGDLAAPTPIRDALTGATLRN
jgi:L-threonylcarbamoyladenylate synthase